MPMTTNCTFALAFALISIFSPAPTEIPSLIKEGTVPSVRLSITKLVAPPPVISKVTIGVALELRMILVTSPDAGNVGA